MPRDKKTDARPLEKRVEKLSDFIIDEGLAEKFNKSMEKEIKKSRDIGMDFSR